MILSSSAFANTLTIERVDPGGEINTYIGWYERVAKSGDDIRVDGICISACTLFLDIVPLDRVCLTEKAAFGIHLASKEGKPDTMMTMILQRSYYPKFVNEWIAKHIEEYGPLTEKPVFMFPKDFEGHIKMCDGLDYPPNPPEEKKEEPKQEGGQDPNEHRSTFVPVQE